MSTATVERVSLQERLKERRKITDVVTDLVSSSTTVPTPDGLITLVDSRFLRELTDVALVTGETIYAVVDAEHLQRTLAATGVQEPTVAIAPRDESLTKTDIRNLIHHYGWSNKEFAMELGVSVQRVSDWLVGLSIPNRSRNPHLYELIDAMDRDKAIEEARTA